MTPDRALVRAARRAVEMIRWWQGAPAQLMPPWSVLSVALIEDAELVGPARELVAAVEERDGWPPDKRKVVDDLAAAVERAEQAHAEDGAR